MANLNQTFADLDLLKRQWRRALPGSAPARKHSGRLVEIAEFGPDPGNLRMFAHVPPKLAAPKALVVVLHGCTQTAAGYDHGAGWSALADRYGFCVLFPEQRAVNNPKLCFNWFAAGDTTRGQGEVRSIRSMVEAMVRAHDIDRDRIFITGLSAGGAMTAAMLATYPEVFAAGAIIAGLPYGTATTVQDALAAMLQGQSRPAQDWGDRVRAASAHRGPWPRIAIWHGEADTVVTPGNAGELVKQWLDVHGIDEDRPVESRLRGARRRSWSGARGVAVEELTVPGLGHGTPLRTSGTGEDICGHPGPFFLEAGVSSTFAIAEAWGLTRHRMPRSESAREEADAEEPRPRASAPHHAGDIAATIRKAFAAAGLTRPGQ